MNFRPAKLKVILSVLISALIWLIVFVTFKDLQNQSPDFIVKIFSGYNFFNFFASENLIMFAVQFVVVYVLFSLIQHKKVRPN